MSEKPNLLELVGEDRRIRMEHPSGLPDDVLALRRAEKTKRSNLAVGMAGKALRRLHHDDYRSLCEQALEVVNAERGPLPGDEAS